jgi:Spy/CpxP family protein refolding chaperone
MKRFAMIVLWSIVMTVMASPVYADKACKRNDPKGIFGHGILMKMHMAIENQERLKLSEDQITKIKNLDADTRKEMIKMKADIELIDVDLNQKLMDEALDIKATNELIDKKYDLKKEKAKAIVAAHAQFKELLSKEQEEVLKKLAEEKKKNPEKQRPCKSHKRMKRKNRE